jgi:sulfide dehydrogenase cytochrome subunit
VRAIMKSIFLLAVMGLTLASSAHARDLPELVSECEACHGPGGISSQPDVPALAGKSVTYLREMLDQFYNYERHCQTTTYRHGDRARTPMSMCAVANDLSEDEKQALAEHFANAVVPPED